MLPSSLPRRISPSSSAPSRRHQARNPDIFEGGTLVNSSFPHRPVYDTMFRPPRPDYLTTLSVLSRKAPNPAMGLAFRRAEEFPFRTNDHRQQPERWVETTSRSSSRYLQPTSIVVLKRSPGTSMCVHSQKDIQPCGRWHTIFNLCTVPHCEITVSWCMLNPTASLVPQGHAQQLGT